MSQKALFMIWLFGIASGCARLVPAAEHDATSTAVEDAALEADGLPREEASRGAPTMCRWRVGEPFPLGG